MRRNFLAGVSNRNHKPEDKLNIWLLVFFTLILQMDNSEVTSCYLLFAYSKTMF